VYMGIHTLGDLVAGLVRHGFDPTTPAALVERGGTCRARILAGSLPELVDHAVEWTTGGPILVLIGEIVGKYAGRKRHGTEALARASAVTVG